MHTRKVLGVAHNTTYVKMGMSPPGGKWPVFGSRGIVMRHETSLSCWCRPELQYVEVPVTDPPDEPYVTV